MSRHLSQSVHKLISHSWINRWKNCHQISLKNLGSHEAEPGKCKYSHTTSCGDNVETSGLLSDQNIVGLHLVPDDLHLAPDGHDEIEESSPTVSTNDAYGAIELLQRYVISIDNTELTPILSLLQQIKHILENNCTYTAFTLTFESVLARLYTVWLGCINQYKHRPSHTIPHWLGSAS